MVRAEHLVTAPQGVLAQRAGRLSLSKPTQGAGDRGCSQQSDHVVRPENSTAALQGVLAQDAGRCRLAQ
jgi:hypothetical protein